MPVNNNTLISERSTSPLHTSGKDMEGAGTLACGGLAEFVCGKKSVYFQTTSFSGKRSRDFKGGVLEPLPR